MKFFMKLLHKLGEEGPRMALMIIGLNCLVLATVRPLITLFNPKESMERKRYAALREALTELVAIPVVVGLGFVFKNWAAPLLYKKQSSEINKDVIQKISAVSGVTVGNLMVPFAATTVINSLFKLFPHLKVEKKPPGPKPSTAEHKAQEIFTAIESIEKGATHSNPKKLLLPASSHSYTAFRPIYRAPSL
jgi:hypothetical protein